MNLWIVIPAFCFALPLNLFLSEIFHAVKCVTHDWKCLGKDTGILLQWLINKYFLFTKLEWISKTSCSRVYWTLTFCLPTYVSNKTRCYHLSSPIVDSVAKQILLNDFSTESLYRIMKFFTKNREIVIHMINRVFTWRHGGHISFPKQWNVGQAGVPNQSTGSWTLFLCKRSLLFQ